MAKNSHLSKTGNFGQPETASVKNLVFIDGAVEEARLLWNDLDPATAAVILDSDRDGVVQITQYLLEYIKHEGAGGNLHIVSHGAPGCLYLGNTQLSLDTLEHYWGDLQQWVVDSLLLYGCHVAAGDAGEEFLAKLHAATGANLGASNSKTGNASKGGNWNLEVTVPEVKCPVVFSQAVQNAYPGVLSDVNVSITADTLDGDTSSISALIATPGADSGISLREAVIAANNTVGNERIILTSDETYDLTITGREEDAAATGDLDITDNRKIPMDLDIILDITDNGKITIQTTGAEEAVIDAGGIDRVFDVFDHASLTLENVKVTGGDVTSASFPENSGGGIRVNSNGTLELTHSTVSGNSASWGGGIFNVWGTASIANSTVSGNTARWGGGIYNVWGTASIANSTVSGNSASLGGGIYNYKGTASIANSTVSGNTALNGGGIHNYKGTASIANSTVSGNTAYDGGGIFNQSGTASIANSTVSGNTALNGGGIFNQSGTASIANSTASIANSTVSGNTALNGGGIFNQLGTASIANSIIAANADEEDLFNNGGTFTSEGHNLIGNNNGITEFTDEMNGDIVGTAGSPVEPILGPLEDNGGETFTHALLPRSPAINAGNDSNIPIDVLDVDGDGDTTERIDIDQRGEDRIQGDRVDIGAFEDDTAGATITETSGSTEVAEGGATDTYMVVLDAQPTGNVIVNITPDSQTSVDPPSLTFTGSDWNTAQTVTVTADDDSTVEGDHTSAIVHFIAPSSAAEYLGISIDDVTVDITDNDGFSPMTAGNGNDPLTATSGPDPITSGKGQDVVTGGGGRDRFAYTQLKDRIMDLVGEDKDKLLRGHRLRRIGQGLSDRGLDPLEMWDPDGMGDRGRFRLLAGLENVMESAMDGNNNNSIF